MVDTFGKYLKNDREAFIMNTDTSQGSGIHWIVLMPIDNEVFIVDSLSPSNPRPNDRLMFGTIAKYGMHPIFYDGEFQYMDDSMCGWYAIYVATKLNSYRLRMTVPLAEKLVYKEFGRTADEADVQKLIKAFGLTQK